MPATAPSYARPYAGLKVLDLSQGIAGPYCGMLLAQYGADVLKVEPAAGDWGRALLARLAARCDVVLENFRPGVADRLGAGYEAVRQSNPKVLYVSVSAFGQRGPGRDLPGSDTVAQAFSGMMMVNRDAAGVPRSTGFLTADYATALYAFQALAAALAARPHEPEGRHLDVSLMQASASFLAMKIIEERMEGGLAPKLNAPAGSYRTKDGWIAVTLTKEAHFGALCAAIDRPALAAEPRFADFALRAKNLAELAPLVQDALLAKTTREWLAAFHAADVLASAIHGFTSWLEDPQVRAMDVVAEEASPGLPSIPWVKIPGAIHPGPDDPRARWPDVGADAADILRDVLELNDDEIARLRDSGALT